MTKIELNGEGFPIPTEAMPEGLVEGAMTPLTFTFTEDGTFDKTEWAALGYTTFESMCVGAAGGRGSFAWYMLGGGQMAPTNILTTGGAGGGGGMHIVSGLLSDLDDISAIVVGQAGADAPDAQPDYSPYPVSYNHHGIDVGDPGEDGGYSSFASDVAMASGGKGGEVSPVVISSDPGTSWRPGGNGGEGGIGGVITPGGGADGGIPTDLGPAGNVHYPTIHNWSVSNGEQGFWDGTIGEGGGGGVGGTGGGYGVGGDAGFITDMDTGGFQILSVHDAGPSGSGHGSFNYADSSKHGARQANILKTDIVNYWNIYDRQTWHSFYIPGTGGGARPTSLAKYGSPAEGYSPNGVVIIRLT